MNKAFKLLIGKIVEVYLDDIIVISKHKAILVEYLKEAFDRISKIGRKLNPKNCTFGVSSGKLLGYFISQRGIKANATKIKAIQDMPEPKTNKEI